MGILSSKCLSAAALCVALGVVSLQSHAAVTFSNANSYIDMAGYADDNNIIGAAGTSEYAATIDVLGIQAQGSSYNYASIVDSFGYETAFSESDAWAEVDAFTFGNNGAIYGYVDSYSSAYAETSAQDAYSYTDSVIDIDFTIDGNYAYTFGSKWMDASGSASFYYDLYSWDAGSIIFSGELINDFDSPWITGALTAGSYNLLVKAVSDADVLGEGYGAASGNFGLALTAVPVPAAAWLFGSGLIALAGFARRKSK